MRFESPWALLLLLLLPALVWWRRKRLSRGATIGFSWTADVERAGESVRQRAALFFPLLRILALGCLVVALARPQQGMEQVRELHQGIAIEMVVDRSPSMAAKMTFKGTEMNRLEVVKRVFQTFVLGDGGALSGRVNDLVGMVAFARYAETVCPLTLAHEALPQFLETVRLAEARSGEDGTAIGDAVALAAARLRTAEQVLARQTAGQADRFQIQSKIMILLTDGMQTAGKRDPKEAAQLAKEWGIKIYTIAVGGNEASPGGNSVFARLFQMGQMGGMDTETLKAMAELTGGQFFEARDASSLASIYKDIDRLERSEIQAARYIDYRELFLPFAAAGLLLLVLESVLNCTLFRRIP